jgi:copper resistance protein B
MNPLKPLILLCMLLPLHDVAIAQMTMPMTGHDMSNMTDNSMADMPGMDHGNTKPAVQPPAQPTPAVGSLPSSDGSTGKPLHVDGMNMDIMEMNDDPLITKFMLDKLEYVHGDTANSLIWDGRLRLGYDLNKLWIRSEGQRAHGKTQDADAELLWGHTYAAYWDVMSGIRHDFGTGPARDWAAFGIQGLAPYKFDVEATAYVGTSGRAAMRLKTAYDLLLTQRMVLTPELEANLYTQDDSARGIGAGLSDTSLGLRLRYEIRREFAPYIGVNYVQKYGKTADLALADHEAAHDLQWIAGVRMWY